MCKTASRRNASVLLFAAFLSGCCCPPATSSGERQAARYMDSVRRQPPLLLAFLREMPKGGDLHVHLSGAIYAESLIEMAVQNGLCVDRATFKLQDPPCQTRKEGKQVVKCGDGIGKPAASCAYQDQVLYGQMIDAWSMRNWDSARDSGHDHFFATFEKFDAATKGRTAEMIAEAAKRAASDHLQYLELMHTAKGEPSAKAKNDAKTKSDPASEFLKAAVWDDDFGKMYGILHGPGLTAALASIGKQLDQDEAKVKGLLKCGTAAADPGCDVTVRYLYQVLRGKSPETVFAQILLGFELVRSDPRFVGINLVMPEDWHVPMHDFDLHMRMLDYLHGVYTANPQPGDRKVHISLHAGELAMDLVAPEGLRFHIRESVELGHAERIGHGVDVMNESDPIGLMHEMGKNNVLVEICLTSNDGILGVRGAEHPLKAYLDNKVPVALATDDQGVSRSDMTHEYLRAAENYDFLAYRDLKRMARESLEHSFLPGNSLWADAHEFRAVNDCSDANPITAKISSACKTFLGTNERAETQWKLEVALAEFERRF